MLKDFLVGKWDWIIYVVKAHLFHDLYFVYIVYAIITLEEKT